jgi:hypothetical protein
MTNALRTELEALASTFATAIVETIRSSSLAEILDVNVPQETPAPRSPRGSTTKGTERSTSPRPGRPLGSTSHDTGATVELLVKYLRSHPGSPGEEARKSLGLLKHTWNARVSRAIKEGKVRKEGELRSTRYWAV